MTAVAARPMRDGLLPARRPPKQLGRGPAVDGLRARCLEHVRERRGELLDRLRKLGEGDDAALGLRDVARELVRGEASARATCGAEAHDRWVQEEDWDEEDMLALEEELLRALECEQAAEEVAWFAAVQEEEDRALYEQHLIGGVPCPLCGLGRLERRGNELCCGTCMEMSVPLLDDAASLDDVSEMLGAAEDRHRMAGCAAAAEFRVGERFGASALTLQCEHCGWCELAL
mmetsp:Transcript_52521/g.145466  ORF Transcript_52521/g.145466 Transcript_52521/m.145466 type:complete len:231 (+) Transcript_52521:55-747(+)